MVDIKKSETLNKKINEIINELDGKFKNEEELLIFLNSPEMNVRLNQKMNEKDDEEELYEKFERAHGKREV